MDDFLKYAKALNGKIPDNALKRNSIYYEYMSYINSFIAFYITEQYDSAILFATRALRLVRKNGAEFYSDQYFIDSIDIIIRSFDKLIAKEEIRASLVGKFKRIVKEIAL